MEAALGRALGVGAPGGAQVGQGLFDIPDLVTVESEVVCRAHVCRNMRKLINK